MNYTLKNGITTAECTTDGGELISFVCDGTEYVWQGDSDFWGGRAPHLFPVVCSPLDGSVVYEGVSYPMPKHGFIRGASFHTIELSPNRIVFETKNNENTMRSFPYRFNFRVTHALLENGFQTSYTVIAGDDMIFNLGGHPAFNCPFFQEESFEDYELHFADNSDEYIMSITEEGYMNPASAKLNRIKNGILPLRYSDFDRDAMIVENLAEKKVDLVSSVTGHGIRFSFEGFDALGIWTPYSTPSGKPAPFLCLEPWRGLPASVDESGKAEDKKYSIKLASGEIFSVGYEIRVI